MRFPGAKFLPTGVILDTQPSGVYSFNPISQIRELRLGNLPKVMQKMWAGGVEQDFHPQVLLGCGLQG